MIKRFIDQEFMTEGEAKYIEDAISNNESLIVAGHRSAGIRPLMATLMAVAKSKYKTVQVKGFDDLEKDDVEYFLIPGLDNIDFEELIAQAVAKPGISFVSLKEPEHPYSIMKILRNVFKENQNTDKIYNMIECSKENDVPFVSKITKLQVNEKGRIVKEDYQE